jgi:CRISPR/Cas system endoribonuclease Cas6 (RAMP superfamily)
MQITQLTLPTPILTISFQFVILLKKNNFHKGNFDNFFSRLKSDFYEILKNNLMDLHSMFAQEKIKKHGKYDNKKKSHTWAPLA